jgi:DNA-binding transcriptional ArsR family regulator
MNSPITTHSTDLKGRQPDNDPAVQARYRLNDVYCGLWLGLAVTALVKRKVFDSVDDEPTSVTEIARRVNLHPPTLYRALRAVAANGILKETGPSVFVHNDVSRLLRTDHQHSWSGMSRMWAHPTTLRSWEKYDETLSDGISGVRHAFGKSLYDHLNSDPDALETFSAAMVSNSAHPAPAIAKALDVRGFKSVADLGGGVGTLLAAILEEHGHLHGTLFEIPELIEPARRLLASKGLEHRSSIVPGDFLESVPDGIDLYLIKNTMWNWIDDQALQIMKNVRRVIGKALHKRFLIVEYVISAENAAWSTLYDLQILNLPGGRARTQPEYAQLLKEAGFSLEAVSYVQDQTILTAAPGH